MAAAAVHFLAGSLYGPGLRSAVGGGVAADAGPDMLEPSGSGLPLPYLASILTVAWVLPALLYWVVDWLVRTPQRTVLKGETATSVIDKEPQLGQELMVLCASLEHSLPHLPKAKAVAGGLGKVMDLVARHHPTNILMVHPMIATGDKVDYGPREDFDTEVPLRLLVDGSREEVVVLRHSTWPHGPAGIQVDFVLLSHPTFEARTKESIYPNPMSRRAVLRFFSLWNQAVGALIARYRPAVFHCPDFHTAVAPWYAHPFYPSLKVLLVLHNAEYEGTISTDMITGDKLVAMAKIWNLPVHLVSEHLIQDGRLNMLKSAVDFVLKFQDGKGTCAVSQYYAMEAHNMYSVLWPLGKIEGLDNPMLEEERASLTESLSETKRQAKQEIQELFNLNVDPEARIFVSLGRLVRQKGVDLLADVAPWLLSKFPKAQFVLIGPVGDGFGHYAANKLAALMSDERFRGRVFVKCEFMRVSDALKFGADFCLMPSRDEPFGYVDIEFAWRGAVVVGAQAGGLGKVPGFYYVAQNRENMGRLQDEIKLVISQAMEMDAASLSLMAEAAMVCDFPLAEWKRKLLLLYEEILQPQKRSPAGWDDRSGDSNDEGEIELSHVQGEISTESTRSSQRVNDLDQYVVDHSGSSYPVAGAWTGDQRRVTFLPYRIDEMVGRQPLMPRPTRRQSAGPLDAPVSAIEAALEHRKSYRGTDQVTEFLTQELAEEELEERMKNKLAGGADYSGIDEIVERIGSDVDWERAEGTIAKWLLGTTLGMKRIHICVSSGYIFAPLAVFLTLVIATEWGMRGGNRMPDWLEGYEDEPWYKNIIGGQGLDPALLNIVLSTANSLAVAIGTPVWAWLSMRASPRRILAMCLIPQGLVLATCLPRRPTVTMAVGLVFFQGIIASAGLIFIVFNFMVSIKADLSHAALRMGVLEMLRYCVMWFATGYIFIASPSALESDADGSVPVSAVWIFIPIAVISFGTTVISGVLCLFAPCAYKDDRCPGWDLKVFTKRISFLLLSLSDCVGALAMFPSSYFVQWWLANGLTSVRLGVLSIILGLVLAACAMSWFLLLSRVLRHGVTPLIATATLIAPPSLLRAIAQEEVSTYTFWGTSYSALVICVLSLLLEGIRSSALWTVKIRVLNSRWRFLTYATIFVTVQSLVGAVSPFLCEILARRRGASFISTNQKELADAMVASVAPIVAVQFALQICSLPFMSRDLGSRAQERRGATDRCQQVRRRSPIAVAVMAAALLGVCVFAVQRSLVGEKMRYKPVRRCWDVDLSRCESVAEEIDTQSPVIGASGFSQGYGWRRRNNGTHSVPEQHFLEGAKFNCDKLLRRTKGGNTFVVDPAEGRCQILKCPEEVLRPKTVATKQETHVWSYDCYMRGQTFVGVQLFEWRWTDIGRECKSHLGEAGFDFVQVTPPQEHVVGDVWWVRYRPVSYKLESRSGSREEFEQMVRDCRESGVSVMADVVLNHMAMDWLVSPHEYRNWVCSAVADDPEKNRTTRPCMGWNGTKYSKREFISTHDRIEKKHFHHYPANIESNCELPPWALNRYSCDLFNLPDLDTEEPAVQRILERYLLELYDLGVTMLRIDAASHIYPATLASLLEPLPLDYVVQEMYPQLLEIEHLTLEKAVTIGPITDFLYGQRVTQMFIDAKIHGNWTSRAEHFGELATFETYFRPAPMKGASDKSPYTIWRTPVHDSRAMVFLDNHDTQRHRLKAGDFDRPCAFDGKNMNECRSTYKMGLMHWQATLYMLLYPYGDSARVMSSYSFTDPEEGPPGVSREEYDMQPLPVFESGPFGQDRCKEMPDQSPATPEWDEQDKDRPWVCEHRWPGIPGMIRFRKLTGGYWAGRPQPRHADANGHVAFSVGAGAFAALNRNGKNWWTTLGEDVPWDLAGVGTGLPEGVYCNLAVMSAGDLSAARCPEGAGARVSVGRGGEVLAGSVGPYGVVALHERYRLGEEEPAASPQQG